MYTSQQIQQLRQELTRQCGKQFVRCDDPGYYHFVFAHRLSGVEIKFSINENTGRYDIRIWPEIGLPESRSILRLAPHDRTLNHLCITSKATRPPDAMAKHIFRNLLSEGRLFERWANAKTAALTEMLDDQILLKKKEQFAESIGGTLIDRINFINIGKAPSIRGKVAGYSVEAQMTSQETQMIIKGLDAAAVQRIIAALAQTEQNFTASSRPCVTIGLNR